MYLDSDNMPAASIAAALETSTAEDAPLQTPSYANKTSIAQDSPTALTGIWESIAYKRHGAMFFVDFWRTSADNPVWSISEDLRLVAQGCSS